MTSHQPIEFKRATPHPESGAYSLDAVAALFELPFNDLVFQAQTIHRQHFDANKVQLSTLLSVKTGGCSEDCGYCSQSARYDTGLEKEVLMNADEVIDVARIAKENGASRFCMGAAWRGPKTKDLLEVKKMIAGVKALGLETCATFGMLKEGQAEELRDSGLDYYNHNLDTSPENYANVVTSHSYQDRLDTLGKVRKAGLNVCSGGIVGLGETRLDRVGLIAQLANLEPQPDSVPINNLVKIEGTPLEEGEAIDWTEFVRMIAVARITMPKSFVRLSAGRQQMPEAMQALCFMAGANSIFYGDKLLTTGNPDVSRDKNLFAKLNIKPL
ncbi:biotin synthase BioB [Iodobacter fluviatilis]|uniref:Biotin synthase n=1 Tax=Iodobacter fluviatilis TaxID=537 RepID=A0A7G3G5E8_9NEIS|nr:biotin synthase BioB [Iodobacter fluviatilis]QBC42497.1 biotin synthase BioB [Iodobacter fluviatilis]